MDQLSDSPIHWSAAEVARRIAARQISSVEVVRAHIARIEEVDASLNAVVVRRFKEAIAEAEAVDRTLARSVSEGAGTLTRSVSEGTAGQASSGTPTRPLLGVPVTVKECFHVAGTPSCIGVGKAAMQTLHEQDGLLVQRLKRAGAIIVGKTNIPQLMIWHECDNPVYGRTNNPWDLERTSGGSTGGEAAIIAARGSPLGLGNDLGGSIRVPCHFCGIHGFKPTTYRLPRLGATTTLRGFEAIVTQPGPLARHVQDLWLALQVLADDRDGYVAGDATPASLNDPAAVRIDRLKIAAWVDDGVFPASPAVQRAVREAADALRQRGASVVELDPGSLCPEETMQPMFDMYCGLIGADGAASARRLSAGGPVDWRVKRLMWIAGLRSLSRLAVTTGLRKSGQHWMARLVSAARPLSADKFWRLTHERKAFAQEFTQNFRAQSFDAVICPPHALPATQHVKGFDLIAAASYSFLFNLLGWPAGTVATTRVRADEQGGHSSVRDQVLRQAAAVQRGSAGLPLGVQVAAPYWREDVALAVMFALESAFKDSPEYPLATVVP